MEEFFAEYGLLIIATIPGIAASIALYLNKKTHDKEVRNQNFLIIEKLDLEFQQIESGMSEILLAKVEKTMSKEVLEKKESIYKWDFIRFHEKMAYQSNKEIIPKHTASFYDHTFGIALGHAEKIFNKKQLAESYPHLITYCKENKIKPI